MHQPFGLASGVVSDGATGSLPSSFGVSDAFPPCSPAGALTAPDVTGEVAVSVDAVLSAVVSAPVVSVVAGSLEVSFVAVSVDVV